MSIRFLHPEMAIWLWLMPVAVLFWYLQFRSKLAFRRRSGFGRTLQSVSRFSPLRRDLAVLAAVLLCGGAVVLATMRPQLLFERRLPEYERQDLVLMLDRSASMLAQDVSPSRFGRAIREIKAFLSDKPDEIDRIGLIGFAGSAVMLSHLTRDLNALFFFLDWIGEDPELYFGTDIAGALTSARELTSGGEPASSIYLLLSDGDDPNSALPDLLQEYRQAGMQVHSIGIGSQEEVPIPIGSLDGETQYLQDDSNQLVTTSFNPATLRMVASMTAGSFFRSTTGRDLAGFMDQVIRQERRQTGWKQSVEHHDMHVPLLLLGGAAAFFLFLKV